MVSALLHFIVSGLRLRWLVWFAPPIFTENGRPLSRFAARFFTDKERQICQSWKLTDGGIWRQGLKWSLVVVFAAFQAD
jgi:hypothetical protein